MSTRTTDSLVSLRQETICDTQYNWQEKSATKKCENLVVHQRLALVDASQKSTITSLYHRKAPTPLSLPLPLQSKKKKI